MEPTLADFYWNLKYVYRCDLNGATRVGWRRKFFTNKASMPGTTNILYNFTLRHCIWKEKNSSLYNHSQWRSSRQLAYRYNSCKCKVSSIACFIYVHLYIQVRCSILRFTLYEILKDSAKPRNNSVGYGGHLPCMQLRLSDQHVSVRVYVCVSACWLTFFVS